MCNPVKMLTPPKSKSPWEAMTAGSTGGWAAGFEPWGPAINTAAGAVGNALLPGAGTLLSAGLGLTGMAGKGTGFQGTDKGWDNLGSSLWGAGLGALEGIGGTAIGHAVGGLAGGGGVGASTLSQAIPWLSAPTGAVGSSPAYLESLAAKNAGIQGIATPISQLGVAPAAGAIGAGLAGGVSGSAGAGASTINQLANLTMGTQGATKAGFGMKEMLGAGLLGASALQKPPTLTTSEGTAREAIYQPNLVEARNMFRTMAFQDPSELVSPATDKYIEASLKQSRQANERAKETMLNTYSASGKVAGKSGAVDKQIARMDKEQLDRETDFITKTNEARYLSGIKLKVDAVQQYYNISYQEAMDLLASYGYVSETDRMNYEAEMAAYNNSQEAMGVMGGNLLQGVM